MTLARRIRVAFDPRQVGFESHPLKVLLRSVTGVRKQRTCEQYRTCVELLVRWDVSESSRPDQLVGHSIKVEIGGRAAANWYQSLGAGECRVKAPEIVFSPSGDAIVQVMHAVLSAGSAFALDRVAVFGDP
jgi:hypothetical protein